MPVINMIKKVKLIHPETVALVKMGEFYHVYGRDAYILANLFGYKLNIVEKNYYSVRFSGQKFK